jgi:CBS domain-containing protein
MSTSMTNLKISDVLLPLDKIPVVSPTTLFKESIEKMGLYNLGILSIIDDNGKLVGIITDGDIRRIILKSQKPFAALFVDDSILHANAFPMCTMLDAEVSEAISIMEDNKIWDLPVVDKDGHLLGLLHLHPIVKYMMDC